MSCSRLLVAVFLCCLTPCLALAAEAPRWSYVEAGYTDFDPDGGPSDDGVYAEGSFRIFRMFHLLAEYNEVGDWTFWRAGGGWHGLLGEPADLFAEVVWNDVDYDSGANDVSDDGYEVSGGVRWSILKWLEIRAQANRVDLDDAGSDTTFEGEGVVKFLKGRVGVGANYRTGDTDTLRVFGRFNFGK